MGHVYVALDCPCDSGAQPQNYQIDPLSTCQEPKQKNQSINQSIHTLVSGWVVEGLRGSELPLHGICKWLNLATRLRKLQKAERYYMSMCLCVVSQLPLDFSGGMETFHQQGTLRSTGRAWREAEKQVRGQSPRLRSRQGTARAGGSGDRTVLAL